uniref:Uncharacterized protein n=1 Tax=Arundo donax TaxID=35708 RepID=A0A0A9FCW0_ARUDO
MAHSLDPCSRVHKTEKPEEIITEKTKPINRRN